MITILCAGSRGDYQPYIALAQQLKKLGKDVRITASKSFEPFIKGYDIDIYPVEADLHTLDIDPKLLKEAGSADNPLKMFLTFNKMKEYGIHTAYDYFNACMGSELIIYHPGCTIGYFAGQKLGIPSLLASPFPMHKTKETLSVVMYGKSKPNPLFIKMSYEMLQSMLWLASSFSVKAFWKKEFGTLPEHFSKPYESAPYPSLISCSSHVFNRPSDWNPNIHQHGYWFVEETRDYTPPKNLEDFLSAGDKPVYIGFGSMAMTENLEKLFETAVEALTKLGKRGILSGFGEARSITKDIMVIESVPHTWLFDRVSVVCHHGGAGTSAAGFSAGVPSVIIPFSNDQFAWAYRAFHLGIASKPISKKKLTSDNLAQAIQNALKDDIVLNARAIGDKLRAENGALSCANVAISSIK